MYVRKTYVYYDASVRDDKNTYALGLVAPPVKSCVRRKDVSGISARAASPAPPQLLAAGIPTVRAAAAAAVWKSRAVFEWKIRLFLIRTGEL